MFIKYCVFSKILKYIPDSGLSRFPLIVSVCTHTRQVDHQRCSRTCRVQKNHNIFRKNTIFNEQPVQYDRMSYMTVSLHSAYISVLLGTIFYRGTSKSKGFPIHFRKLFSSTYNTYPSMRPSVKRVTSRLTPLPLKTCSFVFFIKRD